MTGTGTEEQKKDIQLKARMEEDALASVGRKFYHGC